MKLKTSFKEHSGNQNRETRHKKNLSNKILPFRTIGTEDTSYKARTINATDSIAIITFKGVTLELIAIQMKL